MLSITPLKFGRALFLIIYLGVYLTFMWFEYESGFPWSLSTYVGGSVFFTSVFTMFYLMGVEIPNELFNNDD